MAEYTKLYFLGSGTYGQAWVVNKNGYNGEKVMKEIKLDKLGTKEINQAVTEAEALASCKHKNIIKYNEAFVTKEPLALCIIMEYASFGKFSI